VGWKRIFGLALASLALALVVWGLFSAKISIDVAPPQAVSARDLIPTIVRTQNVSVAEDGSLSIGRAPTQLNRLAGDLSVAFAKVGAPADKASQPVVIWASPQTPRSHIDAVRNVLSVGGWTKVSLSMGANR
jgi:biopolymer transport protein ExbD